jgi:hypothetical protein
MVSMGWLTKAIRIALSLGQKAALLEAESDNRRLEAALPAVRSKTPTSG